MGLELKKQKRRVLLHSMAALARRTKSTSSGGGCVPVLSAGPSPSPSLPPGFALSDESELRKEAPGGDCVLPVALQPRMAPLCMPSSLTARLPLALGLADASVVEDEATVVPECADEAEEDQVEDEGAWSDPSEVDTLFRRASNVSTTAGDITSDESIMFAVALLRRLQQHANESELGEASVRREEVDQILQGFSRALEAVSTTWDERSVEDTVQKLFVTHSNVFDESMQNFFVQNFLHESESAKTFRTALRRTSMLRRCLLAMYQSEHSGTGGRRSSSIGGDKGIASRRWSTAVTQILKQKEEERRRHSIEVCPEVTNPSVVLAVKNEIANIDTSDFDVFAIAAAVPGQTLCIVGNALLEQYEFCSHFRTSKVRVQYFLRQVESRYHAHPYHNAEHAADVAQTLHHFLSVGGLGSLFTERTRCAALLAAIVHDVGHTSYSNNFHITVNDDLAVQYVYRSPLEHMHCALAFQLLKDPQCNILQGLTKIEQLEVRNLITDMVLATDNSVHSAYLAKLESLVRRTTEEGWKDSDPDDERLVLQMALHAADVSNPTKPLRLYLIWAERIKQEFYQQGDKERELLLPVSIGYDREQPIPLEKMQAGFIIGIVRPLFLALSHLPRAQLTMCMVRLDDNLNHWQNEINQKQSPPKPLFAPSDSTVGTNPIAEPETPAIDSM